jgi:hypothetical protein
MPAFTAPAAVQLRKVNIGYTAASPCQAAAIIAKETGLFRKHRLHVTGSFEFDPGQLAARAAK